MPLFKLLHRDKIKKLRHGLRCIPAANPQKREIRGLGGQAVVPARSFLKIQFYKIPPLGPKGDDKNLPKIRLPDQPFFQ